MEVQCSVCFKNSSEVYPVYTRRRSQTPMTDIHVCKTCMTKEVPMLGECISCHKIYLNFPDWHIEGKCFDCGMEGRRLCDNCARPVPVDTLKARPVRGRTLRLCEKCCESLITCPACHMLEFAGLAPIFRTINGDVPYCESCFADRFYCEECHKILSRAYRNAHSGLCQECTDKQYTVCTQRGCLIRRGDELYLPTDVDHRHPMCHACWDRATRDQVTDRHRQLGIIFNYRFDVPRGLGLIVDETKKLFGVELEVCVDDDADLTHAAQQVYKTSTQVVCKSDSSIRYGFEIVTAPLEMAAMQSVMNSLLAKAQENGLREDNSCGMHVHLSRALIPRAAVAKALLFMHTPANVPFVRWVARRSSADYASLAARKWKDVGLFGRGDNGEINTHRRGAPETFHQVSRSMFNIPEHLSNRGWQNGGRYQAINLCNRNTIEFRIFASTIDPKMACANLEFCQALIDFTSGLRPMADVRSAEVFIRFVEEHRKDYPAFAERLVADKEKVAKAVKSKPEAQQGNLFDPNLARPAQRFNVRDHVRGIR